MENTTEERIKPKIDRHNLIIWILGVTMLWYVGIFEFLGMVVFDWERSPIYKLFVNIGYMSDAVFFAYSFYLVTLMPFLGIIVYTMVTKRNRFVLRSLLPKHENNKVSVLLMGFLVGFVMNFGCIVCALANGDIKLYLDFALEQIPFYIFAFICVFIQSSSEEMWCRGFMYERINVRYPLWVAILANGLFFAALHLLNPGVSVLPIMDIAICGLSFSIAKWYTNSIWFVMGIHTTWNFTQNFLFGLPNSGLVSEASIFTLDAATAHDSLVYDVGFGVEGAFPAVLSDLLLGVVCLILAARKNRLGELLEKKSPEVVGDHSLQYTLPLR